MRRRCVTRSWVPMMKQAPATRAISTDVLKPWCARDTRILFCDRHVRILDKQKVRTQTPITTATAGRGRSFEVSASSRASAMQCIYSRPRLYLMHTFAGTAAAEYRPSTLEADTRIRTLHGDVGFSIFIARPGSRHRPEDGEHSTRPGLFGHTAPNQDTSCA
jgi:hypothetical protein